MRAAATPNAMPLSGPQWAALVRAAGRELTWGLRAVSREVRIWRARAERIPDPALRRDALAALDLKRGHTDGAAMFWTLPNRREPALLHALVRYELLQDYLDSLTEAGAAVGPDHGGQLYRALGDALDLDRSPADCYSRHQVHDDDGYLVALVAACREGCRTLPGYAVVRPLLIRETKQASVLILNHQRDAAIRDAALRAWAARHFPHERELSWFELTAAASGWITTHALLALAAEPRSTPADAEATYAAYFPWAAMMLTMLDSYADQAEDERSGNHGYIAHYATPERAAERLRESIGHAAAAVLELPHGERHGVLLGCMIALYLTKDSARAADLRSTSTQLAGAGGTLPRLLMPALRLWRIRNGQRSAT
jgi:tetraprenyl-beta-curcumene synthase